MHFACDCDIGRVEKVCNVGLSWECTHLKREDVFEVNFALLIMVRRLTCPSKKLQKNC